MEILPVKHEKLLVVVQHVSGLTGQIAGFILSMIL